MLRDYYPSNYAHSVFAIDFAGLHARGYRGLVFDIDNTLVHHGDDSTPEVDALMARLRELGFGIVMLTNNDEQRVRRFLRNIDARFVCDAAKPDPRGFREAVQMLGLPPDEVLVIGDSVFTDIRGANRCGLASVLVRFIHVEGEPLGKRRRLESLILALYKRSKRCYNRLGDIEVRDPDACGKATVGE